MTMTKSSSTPALVILLLLLVIGAPTMTSAQCNVGSLQSCLPAVTSSAMPTPGCCNALRSQTKPCFCGYFKNPTFRKNYNPSVASKISKACVEEVLVDTQKELITVKGIMDVKTMVPHLQDKFKRNVEIAPAAAKKDDGGEKAVKKDDGDGDKKDKEKSIAISSDKGVSGDGEKKKDGGGDAEKKKDGGGEKEKDGGEKKEEVVGTTKVETSKMEYYSGGYVPYEQHYMQYPQTQQYQQHYQYQYQPYQQQQMPMPMPMVHQVPQMPTPQYSMFSDEDPNACSIM